MTNSQQESLIYQLDRTHKIRTWLAGKSILLVGGGEIPEDYSEIGYDVVCRVNSHFWQKPQPGRCDMLVHNCTNEAKIKLAMEHVHEIQCFISNNKISSYQMIQDQCLGYGTLFDSLDYSHAIESDKPHYNAPWFKPWLNAYAFRPFTGCLALQYLREMPVSKIYVTGFDLYDSERRTMHDPNWVGPHNILLHARYLLDVEAEDDRVTYNPKLSDAIFQAMVRS
jgi:hypothetical protein